METTRLKHNHLKIVNFKVRENDNKTTGTVLTEKFMLLNWLMKGFIQGSSCLLTGLFI